MNIPSESTTLSRLVPLTLLLLTETAGTPTRADY